MAGWSRLALLACATAAAGIAGMACGNGSDASPPSTNTALGRSQGDAGLTDAAACLAIGDLRLASSSGSTVNLAWTGSSAASVSVLRKTYCGDDDYEQLATLPAGTSTYTDTSDNASWAYWYEIVATDDAGNSGTAAIDVWAGSATPPDGCPGGATPQASGAEGAACTSPLPVPGADGGSATDGSAGAEGGAADGGPGGGSANPTPIKLPDGQTYSVAAGASTAAIESAITTAAGAGGVVALAAGKYSVTSQIDIPCPAKPIAIIGPATNYPYSWADRPTATLVNAIDGGAPVFNVATPCSTGVTIAYLEVDGNHPASGGGAVYVGGGGYDNLTIAYNYFHGNQERTPVASSSGDYWVYDDQNASLVYLDGEEGGKTDSDIAISYNILGNPVAGDCSNVMEWIGATLPNGKWAGFDSTGGECAGVGLHSSSTNLSVDHNVFQQQEQAMKFYEGGSTAATFFIQTNVNVLYNDIGFIHRIGLETQQSPTSKTQPMSYVGNDNHDQVYPAFGSWLLSAPQLTYTNATDNLMISNSAQSGAGPANFEAWGAAAYSYNLEQGNVSCGADFGFGGPGEDSYNVIELTVAKACSIVSNGVTILGIQNEFPGTIGQANYPVMVGNTYSSTASVATSVAPTIAPASGSFSGSQTVTLTDAGNTSAAGPRGNTSIWYTTDGSAPGPKSGTSKYYSGPFTITGTTTVKAVGMWGSITQPAAYPAGFGYKPSDVVSATYTAE